LFSKAHFSPLVLWPLRPLEEATRKGTCLFSKDHFPPLVLWPLHGSEESTRKGMIDGRAKEI